jgi:signal transduction histidine kinase
MNKPKYILSTIIVILFLVGGCSTQTSSLPMVDKGVIQLEDWKFSDKQLVKLNGEWEFYWEQLLLPDEFDMPERREIQYLKVPMFWHKAKVDENQLSGKGYATYRMQVKLSQNQQGSLMGIYIPFGVESAYSVWVNGNLVATAGKVGTSKVDMIGQYYPKVAVFQAREENEIIIHISNFVQRTGGLWDPIVIGGADDLVQFWNKRLAKELFVAGSIVMIGLYHLGLFFIRRKDQSPLYFGAFCLLIGLRSLFLGEVYISHMLPNLSFDVYKKFEYIGQYMGPALFLLYVQSLYPNEIKKRLVQLAVTIYSVMSVIVLVMPATLFTYTLPISHLVLVVFAPYIIYVFIRAARRKRDGALFSCLMFLVMALTVINDVLYYNDIIETFDMAKFGLFSFIFAQAFLLSIKFSKAFKSVEELSKQQAEWSLELEKTVNNRTKDLQTTLEDLQVTQKQLVESEKMAALGGLVAGVAHEINTPVGVSVTATSHLEQKTKEIMNILLENRMKKSDLVSYLKMANESTEIISKNLKRASELVKSFKLVAVDQSTAVKREFNFKDYLNEVILSLGPQLKRHKHQIYIDCPDQLVLYSDPGVFSQIFTNLIMNSITHGFEPNQKGIINIRIHRSSVLLIEYRDNGIGMSNEIKERMFEPFFTTNRAGGGTGLGMHIVYNLVTQSLGGTIECESEPGNGTVFLITIDMEEM